MNARVAREAAGLCPTCSNGLRIDCGNPAARLRCPACKKPLWFFAKTEKDAAILLFLPSHVTRMEGRERFDEVLRAIGSASAAVVDLDCLDSVSSSFLSMLVALRKRLDSAGKKLRICGLHGQTEEAFWRTFFTRIFDICPDANAALASL